MNPELWEKVRERDALEFEKSAQDPLYWLTKHVNTKDEHAPARRSVRRFPSKPHVVHATQRLHEMEPVPERPGEQRYKHHTIIIGKSRQIMMSWWAVAMGVHRGRFYQNRTIILQSKRGDDAKAIGRAKKAAQSAGGSPAGVGLGLLGRAQFIESHMTPGLRLPIPESKEYIAYPNGSIIWAIPHGSDVVRSHTPSFYLGDEFAFHGPEAASEWQAIQPAIEGGLAQALIISTPNQHEFFYTLAPWDEWRSWPEVEDGIHELDRGDGRLLLFFHYTADPEKRSVEFRTRMLARYKTERPGAGERRYAQEMEGDFGIRAGEPVWPEFARSIHLFEKCPPVLPYLPMWRGWDFGFNGQACLWAQEGPDGMVWIHRALLMAKIGLQDFVRVVNTYYTDVKHFIDCGDPSAQQHNQHGVQVVQTLAEDFDINLRYKTTTGRKVDLQDQVRDLLPLRGNGLPGIRMCPACAGVLVQAMEGGYHFKEVSEGVAEKDVAEKDGYYEHVADALQYLIDHLRPYRRGKGFDKARKTFHRRPVPGTPFSRY